MIRALVLAATATAIMGGTAIAHEGMDMPGMDMSGTKRDAPTKPVPVKSKKPPAKKKSAPKAAPLQSAPAHVEEKAPAAAAGPMQVSSPPPSADQHGDHGGMAMPEEKSDAAAPEMKMPDAAMSATDMAPMTHNERMSGLFGNYSMTRDASGTSWQPNAASHAGLHLMSGDWMFMGHIDLTGAFTTQGGPRGDDKAFAAGMIMGSARRDFADGGVLNLRAMLSPDPLMGKSGYPLLLAAGETADGSTLLRDRQHPHDLFMELSASYAHPITDQDSVFIYGGLPGEPAFGPPTFMHRITGMDNPEAPISHHWLDSTHITFGVLTLGWVHNDWKIEASSFRGREPDQDRYDIESPRLDSEAVRLSWNPTERWALQASWADLKSPEALHPDEDETRWSASATYVLPLGDNASWSATAAYGLKQHGDQNLDAWLFETAWKPNEKWTIFGRFETLENSELALPPLGEDPQNVSRVSIGAVRDFAIREHVKFGIGGLVDRSFVSDALSPSYDGDQNGAMAFVRLKIE